MTLRWYGKHNPIPIQYIKQIPCVTGIVSEVEAPVGALWPEEEIRAIRREAADAGLRFDVVESVKVHEDIKLGLPSRDEYIEHFIQNLRLLGKNGVSAVCYDFMPVFDWMRTQTHHPLPDGSTTMAYYHEELGKVDPLQNGFALEDWEAVFSPEELRRLFAQYAERTEEDIWQSLAYFLRAVVPEAERAGVRLGMHPDDPPWKIFGLPRIMTCERNLDRLLSLVDSPFNALTLCSGSLGASPDNDVPALIRKYAGQNRICFGHVRNVKFIGGGDFEECSHYAGSGSLDVVDIMRAYFEAGYDGPIRPDHGRMIFGESGMAGYGLYDRALGAMYVSGIWDALEKEKSVK